MKLGSGIGPELMRSGDPVSELQMQAARAAQATLVETLVNRLASYGLPAEHHAVGRIPAPGSLLIQGQIVCR